MADTPSYQQLNEELQRILDSLQSSELDIEEALQLYERGHQIIKKLQLYLKHAEGKVKVTKTAAN